MESSVRLTPRAAADAEQLYRRLVAVAPIAGQQWYERLVEAIDSLSVFPARCEVVDSLSTPARTVRKLLFGRKPHTYRIYFDVVSSTVRILHIRHGARREPSRKDLTR